VLCEKERAQLIIAKPETQAPHSKSNPLQIQRSPLSLLQLPGSNKGPQQSHVRESFKNSEYGPCPAGGSPNTTIAARGKGDTPASPAAEL
jgi:hypothetical protein